MRTFSMMVFASVAVVALAAVKSVNLDAPGALEALKHDRPADYAKVVEAMNRVQAVPYSETAQHNLLATLKPDPTRRDIKTSFPAKTHLTVPVDDANYEITVMYLNNPAKTVLVK
jgi:hypothetical protein